MASAPPCASNSCRGCSLSMPAMWPGAPLDEARVPREAHRDIFELYTFCQPEGEQLLGYPVPGHDGDTVAGRRRYNIVWYRPADSVALDDMCTDASGRLHSGGVAPSLIRDAVLAAVKADAEALLAPQLAAIFLRSETFSSRSSISNRRHWRSAGWR